VKFSALDYLLKPVQNKELREAVEKHLHKTRRGLPAGQVEGLLNNVQAERKGKPGRVALASKESIEFVDPAKDRFDTDLNLTDERTIKTVTKFLTTFRHLIDEA
jgi:YesN/AraC family two-component response regulator